MSGKIGRPKKPDDEHLNARRMVRMSMEDSARVALRAAGAGMTVSAYLRHMALNGKVTVRQERQLDFQTRNELTRIGTNLNQMMRHCHETRNPPPAALADTLERINAVMDAVYDLMDLD